MAELKPRTDRKPATRRSRVRNLVFAVVIAASIVVLFAVFAASPLANPYEGSRPILVIAVPVAIAIAMAVVIWWLVRHAGSGRDGR